MTRRIFVDVLLLSLGVLLICGGIFFGLRYAQTVEENYDALAEEAAYALTGVALSGQSYLEALETTDRVTWIGPDGTVRYDSGSADLTGTRPGDPEIRAAFTEGEGRAIHDAVPGGVSTIYVAVRSGDGSVLRLSRPVSPAAYAFSSVSPVLWTALLLLLVSAALAFSVSRRILRPINEMDPENPDVSRVYPELLPLISRIREQQDQIRQEAESRESLRKEFTANVSHELKTPLTSISGFAELMRDGLVPPERIPEFSSDIYRESQRLIALVDDIMRLSRLDEAQGFPDPEAVSLDGMAEEICRTLEPLAARRGITIRTAGTEAATTGVRQVLHEMIYNLVDNAVKYNVDGGSVTVETGIRDSRPYVAVTDTGIGIPESEQERVFERFYRVDKSHSKTIGGTGLGLSIVKHGAQYHHASVKLESKPGEGTRIVVSFAGRES